MTRGQEHNDTVVLAGEPVDSREWLYVDGLTAPFYRIGDELSPGEAIGQTHAGERIRAKRPGRVAGIEYDWESDQLILVVAPCHQDRFGRSRAAGPGVAAFLAAS